MSEIDKEYLENRIRIGRTTAITHFYEGEQMDISHFNEMVSNTVNAVLKKMASADSFKISFEYDDDDDRSVIVALLEYMDWETDDEYYRRMFQKEQIKKNALKSMKELIRRNPDEAIEYIKELNLI